MVSPESCTCSHRVEPAPPVKLAGRAVGVGWADPSGVAQRAVLGVPDRRRHPGPLRVGDDPVLVYQLREAEIDQHELCGVQGGLWFLINAG